MGSDENVLTLDDCNFMHTLETSASHVEGGVDGKSIRSQ
jgi:hypothetical protein